MKGLILQEVEIEIKYREYDENGQLKAEEKTDGPKINPYHEIFDAKSYHTDTFGSPVDTFAYGKKAFGGGLDAGPDTVAKPNTKGTATFTGYARYYPDVSFWGETEKWGNIKDGDWKAKNPDTWAAHLWSGKNNPNWKKKHAHSALFTHAITVKWDCCLEDKKTEEVYRTP